MLCSVRGQIDYNAMIQAFFSVLKDLWVFLCGREGSIEHSATVAPSTLRPVGVNVDSLVPLRDGRDVADGQGGLRRAFVSVESAYCLALPASTFDGLLFRLPYGVMVGVRRLQDGYAEVVYGGRVGWIAVTELCDDETQVFPQLQTNHYYGAQQREVVALRKCIQDVCLGGVAQLPLQSLEYMVYAISRHRPDFRWPDDRPRTPGMLHTILRGRSDIKMSIEPRTAAVMEVGSGEGSGFFGVVEAVQPDQSIALASVGRLAEGQFLRETFSRNEWKEWRPTFISFL